MIYFSSNLKKLRKQNGLTQDDFAIKLGLTRASIGSYEEGRAVPKLEVITQIADLFNITVDKLLLFDFSSHDAKSSNAERLKILTVVTDRDNNELITVVPAKAAAGYTTGYADREYIGELPKFSLPLNELARERTYRIFQITGDSMLPVPDKSYIICEYIQSPNQISEGKSHIIVSSDDGIVFKRIFFSTGKSSLTLKSDNTAYDPYEIALSEILEIWKAVGYISFDLSMPMENGISDLSKILLEMKEEIKQLKRD